MLNMATRTVRSGASPNLINMMNNDDGLTTNRKTPPFSFPKDDKTGAHSIAALDRYICDSKNGSIYSDNIKAAIGEKPATVNPYIPTGTHKPLPRESFRVTEGRLANSCGCRLGKKRGPLPDPPESFCDSGKTSVENDHPILMYGPIMIIVLVLFAALLVARMILYRKSKNIGARVKTMRGGVINDSFDSII